MSPINKDLTLLAPLPVSTLSPHLQAILDKELGPADKKAQQVFVPTVGGKWKIKK